MTHSKKSPAIFLDRDGTLNYDPGYLSDPDKLVLLPHVGRALRRLQDAGFKLIVITNQSGIARGRFNAKTLDMIHERLRRLVGRHGATLAGIYYCPHHPNANCRCRKPKALLARRAARDHNVDISRSFVIGDNECDIGMAKKLKCPCIIVGSRKLDWNGPRAKTMKEAVEVILRREKEMKCILLLR